MKVIIQNTHYHYCKIRISNSITLVIGFFKIENLTYYSPRICSVVLSIWILSTEQNIDTVIKWKGKIDVVKMTRSR